MGTERPVLPLGSKGKPEYVGVLRELSDRIGAEYVEGERRGWSPLQSHGRVLARAGPWIVTIGICTLWARRHGNTYTEVHAPYLRPGGFRFTVGPVGLLGRWLKKLGMFPFKEVGFRDFDEAFFVKATDNEAVKSLFADEGLRRLFLAQPSVVLEVNDRSMPWASASSSLRNLPDGLALLYGMESRAVLDVERLKGLVDLSLSFLERSCEVGLALREPPGVEIRGPMGTRPVLTSPSDQGDG